MNLDKNSFIKIVNYMLSFMLIGAIFNFIKLSAIYGDMGEVAHFEDEEMGLDVYPAVLALDGVYEISNKEQLNWFAHQVNIGNGTNYNARLTQNVELNDFEGSRPAEWFPIGTEEYPYEGIFDGQNYSISGLFVDSFYNKYIGLFGCIGYNGKVKNLILHETSFEITEDDMEEWEYRTDGIGGICGINKGIIENCINKANIDAFCKNIGGICGINEGTIRLCYNLGSIYSSRGEICIGQICGFNCSEIRNCYYLIDTGDVTGIGNGYDEVGRVEGKTEDQLMASR